jgi:hypothetical protein
MKHGQEDKVQPRYGFTISSHPTLSSSETSPITIKGSKGVREEGMAGTQIT